MKTFNRKPSEKIPCTSKPRSPPVLTQGKDVVVCRDYVPARERTGTMFRHGAEDLGLWCLHKFLALDPRIGLAVPCSLMDSEHGHKCYEF